MIEFETAIISLEIILLLIGLVGCFLPALPGILIVFGATLLQHFVNPNVHYPTWALFTIGLVVIGVVILQNLIPIWGTKKFGASKWAIRGSIIGLILGLFSSFLGPFGIFIFPFLGAVLGELLIAKKTFQASINAGFGAFIGILASSIVEFIFAIGLTGIFIWFQFFK